MKASAARAFVERHTRLQEVPGLPGLQLHLSNDVLALWGAVQEITGDRDAPIPFWAFAWGGGLAIAHYLRERPQVVAGKGVLDLGSGSGLCGIVAAAAGAHSVTAVDVDTLAIAAIELNARANDVRLNVVGDDLLDAPAPDADVILAGDLWYEQSLGERASGWLRRAAEAGAQVLIGDPGRRYLASAAVERLAEYGVRSTTELDDLQMTRAVVYRLA